MIATQEYLDRMQRLQEKVRQHQLDGFLVSGKKASIT